VLAAALGRPSCGADRPEVITGRPVLDRRRRLPRTSDGRALAGVTAQPRVDPVELRVAAEAGQRCCLLQRHPVPVAVEHAHAGDLHLVPVLHERAAVALPEGPAQRAGAGADRPGQPRYRPVPASVVQQPARVLGGVRPRTGSGPLRGGERRQQDVRERRRVQRLLPRRGHGGQQSVHPAGQRGVGLPVQRPLGPDRVPQRSGLVRGADPLQLPRGDDDDPHRQLAVCSRSTCPCRGHSSRPSPGTRSTSRPSTSYVPVPDSTRSSSSSAWRCGRSTRPG
jgi:hypothetical protein